MFPNMDLYVCDFEICGIGMTIDILSENQDDENCSFVFFSFFLNNVLCIERLVSMIDLPLYIYTLIFTLIIFLGQYKYLLDRLTNHIIQNHVLF